MPYRLPARIPRRNYLSLLLVCDYTLIGEELYAASAYLSNEPMLLGTLKGQDIAKLTFMLVLILFTILALLGIDTVSWVLVR